MNKAVRNVVTILSIARLVENTLQYCMKAPAGGFTLKDREERGKALKSLTAKGTPFEVNCRNNGEQGEKLYEDMLYFIDDVYGEGGRIVSVDLNDNVHVESSLIGELFSTIVRLRLYLEGFLASAMKFLREQNLLEELFEECVKADLRLYHSVGGKIAATLILDKFLEVNENANTYMQSYSKSHNGIDPRTDSHFNLDDDPSVRMLKNEFQTLNQDMVTVLNTYGDDDEEFKFARQSLYSDCEIFSGKKKPTDINAFKRVFVSYFDKIIRAAEADSNEKFRKLGIEVTEFNNKEIEERQKQENNAPETKEETANG